MASPTEIEKEKEYETAVAFLRKFHSTQVAALSQTSRTPLGAISETGIGDLVSDFSLALQVESPSKLTNSNAGHARHPLSPSRSPKIKKTATSTCLLDLATNSSSSATCNNSSSNSSTVDDEEVDDSSLFSLHQQATDDIFSDSCSASSDFGVGYYGLNGLGNKRRCSNPIR